MRPGCPAWLPGEVGKGPAACALARDARSGGPPARGSRLEGAGRSPAGPPAAAGTEPPGGRLPHQHPLQPREKPHVTAKQPRSS